MFERMIIVTVPYGSHVLLPESHGAMALSLFKFVDRDNYPLRTVRLVADQTVAVETIMAESILEPVFPKTPEALIADPIIAEAAQAAETPAVSTEDIPF